MHCISEVLFRDRYYLQLDTTYSLSIQILTYKLLHRIDSLEQIPHTSALFEAAVLVSFKSYLSIIISLFSIQAENISCR